MYLIDAFFRFTGLAMLILIAITTYRDNRQWQGSAYLILACISLSGLYLGYTLDALRPPEPIQTIARLIDVPHLVFVWLFAQSLYKAGFALAPVHWLAGIVYCAPIFWVRLSGLGYLPDYPAWLLVYVSVTSLILAGHLIYVTLCEWREDLQTDRRRSRFYFSVVVVLAIGLAAIAEPKLGRDAAINLRTFTILSIWPAIAAGAFWLLRADEKAVHFEARACVQAPLDSRDQALLAKLNEAMTQREVFRDTDLSISGLASDLGVTQHRLRALINETQGHRNFSEFLSVYRLDAVLAAFADPEKSHLPIQTISYDSGFKSVSPFNRAFRAREGCTPSEYRKRVQATVAAPA